MKVLALIPARGGSKGIPRKNIRLLAGKPLIAWTIEAALASAHVSSVVVSTEDDEIADISRQWGAQIPFIRPAELAQDDTPGMAPVLHALDHLTQFDAILLLQPTSPLRTTADIDACLLLAQTRQANAIVSVCEPESHPGWMYTLDDNHCLKNLTGVPLCTRRQDLPRVYALNGALYFARTDWLRQHRSFISEDTMGFLMPKEKSIDIDTLFDWKMAELLLAEQASAWI